MSVADAGVPGRHIVVVMGVSGCGKSSVAEGLRDRLGWAFQEGDLLHPAENVAKMSAGIPLDDSDRMPWLARCAAWIRARHEAGESGVLTCSSLKRAYRAILVQNLPEVGFLYLRVPEAVLKERMDRRSHHYMPSSLLPTQLQALEEPGADEPAIILTPSSTVAATVDAAIARLRAAAAPTPR